MPTLPLKIAILGSGPTAAFVFRACKDHEYSKDFEVQVKVFTNDARTIIPGGAFYFHQIPKSVQELGIQPIPIFYRYYGTEKTYLEKQWGEDIINKTSSFGKTDSPHMGYNPEEVLSALWNGVEFSIYSFTDTQIVDEMCYDWDRVFCTFPLSYLLEHYRKERKLVRRYAISFEQVSPTVNYIAYNGATGSIIRLSKLFNKIHVECSDGKNKSGAETKFSGFTDIHPDIRQMELKGFPRNLHFIGRLAEFNRRRLTHEAYDMTRNILRRAYGASR